MKNNLNHHLKKWPVQLVLLLVSFIISGYLIGFIIYQILWDEEQNLDLAIRNFLSPYISPDLTEIMVSISLFGAYFVLIPELVLLTLWLWFKKKKSEALDAAMVAITSSGLVFLLKSIFQRERPLLQLNEPAYNYSFPSGHTALSIIFYGLLLYTIWNNTNSRRLKYILSIFFFLVTIMIGLSRVYLRKHFTTDIIAGFCIGFAWLALSWWILKEKAD